MDIETARKLPNITRTNNTMLNECRQFNLGTLSRRKALVHFLLLSPELLELALLEIIEISIRSLLYGYIGLSYPLGIIAAILQVDLELADCVPPGIIVA